MGGTVHADRYPPGERVRVVVPGDPRQGEVGQVYWSYADCTDMIHVVRFPDGGKGHYHADEMMSTKVSAKSQLRNRTIEMAVQKRVRASGTMTYVVLVRP